AGVLGPIVVPAGGAVALFDLMARRGPAIVAGMAVRRVRLGVAAVVIVAPAFVLAVVAVIGERVGGRQADHGRERGMRGAGAARTPIALAVVVLLRRPALMLGRLAIPRRRLARR